MPDAMHRRHLAERPRRGRPALLIDRDGTVIEDPGYVSDPDDVRLLPGAAAALRRFRDHGHALVVVTNQSGIGRGYYEWTDYDRVAARLRALLAGEGIVLDAEYACGHAPEVGCDWRKPSPGMILAAATDLDLNLADSLMVGDKRADVEAAAAAGVGRAVHVLTGQGHRERGTADAWRLDVPLELADSIGSVGP